MRYGASQIDTFDFYRVSYPGLKEKERLSGIELGGSIDETIFTALKVSGSMPYYRQPEIGNDFVRTYLTVENEYGETGRWPLATLIPSTPKSVISNIGCSGTMDLYSLLKLLDFRRVTGIYVIPAGTAAIAKAKLLVESCGLVCKCDPSSATLTVDAVFGEGTTYLEIVNYMCDFAGFGSATVDGMGNVLLQRYLNPAAKEPTWEFESGDGCVFAPSIDHELDTFEVPNKVILTCSNSESSLVSVATNADPASRYSTVSRGYEVCDSETVTDIEGQGALDAKAVQLLAEKSSKVESIEMEHVYVPFSMGDVCNVIYHGANRQWVMSAVTRSIALDTKSRCKTRLRRFINV